MFGLLLATVLVTLHRGRRSHLCSCQSLDFLRSLETLALCWFHCSRKKANLGRKKLAEVCRNRTDRSTKGRPTGFEVPDGHQPACTSALILGDSNLSVNFGAPVVVVQFGVEGAAFIPILLGTPPYGEVNSPLRDQSQPPRRRAIWNSPAPWWWEVSRYPIPRPGLRSEGRWRSCGESGCSALAPGLAEEWLAR